MGQDKGKGENRRRGEDMGTKSMSSRQKTRGGNGRRE